MTSTTSSMRVNEIINNLKAELIKADIVIHDVGTTPSLGRAKKLFLIAKEAFFKNPDASKEVWNDFLTEEVGLSEKEIKLLDA